MGARPTGTQDAPPPQRAGRRMGPESYPRTSARITRETGEINLLRPFLLSFSGCGGLRQGARPEPETGVPSKSRFFSWVVIHGYAAPLPVERFLRNQRLRRGPHVSSNHPSFPQVLSRVTSQVRLKRPSFRRFCPSSRASRVHLRAEPVPEY